MTPSAAPDLSPPAAHPPEGDLFARLREETRDRHARLEATLDLLAPPLSRVRFVRVLGRFRGFHAAWEPAIAARPEFAALWPGRARLALLDADLRRLGLSDADIAALPVCDGAARLAADLPTAAGSLYVMEGSTLGGQLIGRRLAQADWTPPGGLAYFDAHGSDTGRWWRALKTALPAVVPVERWGEMVDGADRTFDLLAAWAGGEGGA